MDTLRQTPRGVVLFPSRRVCMLNKGGGAGAERQRERDTHTHGPFPSHPARTTVLCCAAMRCAFLPPRCFQPPPTRRFKWPFSSPQDKTHARLKLPDPSDMHQIDECTIDSHRIASHHTAPHSKQETAGMKGSRGNTYTWFRRACRFTLTALLALAQLVVQLSAPGPRGRT
ncbi:hypothetical protein LY76DRAFT_156997 [Colletotrichum caudatum]|nr:hypothetical protein LY76DRAFT_156997 [Colletotrichum caudatum]